LLTVGVRSGLFRQVFSWRIQRALEQNDLIPVYIVLGIAIAGFILERRPAMWSFPALGILLFEARGWIFTPFADQASPFWQVAGPLLPLAVLAAIAAVAVYRVYKQHGIHIPQLGWVLLCLMILVSVAFVIVGAITDRNPNKWTSLLAHLPLVLWWMGFILLPAAIGLPLARRDGILAGLILVAFEFVLVDEILDPTYHIRFWAYCTPNAKLEQAKIVLSYLPTIFFLIVTPIWVLRSPSTRGRGLGLILPPFIALVSTDVISSIALRGTSAEYSIDTWLIHGVSTAQLLIPLALAAVMYHWLERQGPTAVNAQEDRETLSDR